MRLEGDDREGRGPGPLPQWVCLIWAVAKGDAVVVAAAGLLQVPAGVRASPVVRSFSVVVDESWDPHSLVLLYTPAPPPLYSAPSSSCDSVREGLPLPLSQSEEAQEDNAEAQSPRPPSPTDVDPMWRRVLGAFRD